MEGTLSVNHRPAYELNNRDHAEKRFKSMKGARESHEGEWHKIADFSGYGEIPGCMFTPQGAKRSKMRTLKDSHPIKAFRHVTNGMYSGLSSPNRPWIRFQFVERELNDYQPAAEWLDRFEAAIYDLFAASNFYQQARNNYRDMARFGPACGMMVEHWREIAPTFAIAPGSFWFGQDDALKNTSMIREYPLSVESIVSKFVAGPGGRMDWSNVDPKVKHAYDCSKYDQVVNLKQLIEPGEGQRFNSIIWDPNDGRKVTLEEKSFNTQPFWAPRWESDGADPYGSGVGEEALPDLIELAMQNVRKRELTDLLAKPPTAGPAQEFDMRPGGHTHLREMGPGMKVEPIYKPDPMAMREVREDIRELREKIDAISYSDLFMAISQMPGVQPRNIEELLKRDEERMSQLGPVVESVNDDMLPIAVDRMIDIATRGELLPEAPEELEGKPLKMEFVSVLALAQKMLGMSTTERFVGFVGSLGQVLGDDVLDKIDGDAIVDDYAKRSNVPAAAVRDNADAEAIRDARAQQQQMAQMAEMAQPAKTATEAAQNILELSNDEAQF